MSKRAIWQFAVIGLFLAANAAYGGTVGLGDWCFNFNGDFNAHAPFGNSCNGGDAAAPAGFDATLEPGVNILGTATFNLNAGQYVIFYSNYDVNYDTFGSFDDSASTLGSLPAGWSWMAGDPNACNGCTISDMYDAFAANALTNGNTVGTPSGPPSICCDVSLSLGVVAASTTSVTFSITTTDPGTGFRLVQTNSDTGDSIFVTATLGGGGGGSVPEPSTFLLGIGGAGLLAGLRKWKSAGRAA